MELPSLLMQQMELPKGDNSLNTVMGCEMVDHAAVRTLDSLVVVAFIAAASHVTGYCCGIAGQKDILRNRQLLLDSRPSHFASRTMPACIHAYLQRCMYIWASGKMHMYITPWLGSLPEPRYREMRKVCEDMSMFSIVIPKP